MDPHFSVAHNTQSLCVILKSEGNHEDSFVSEKTLTAISRRRMIYHRLPPPRPPLSRRFSRGRASFTTSVFPFNSLPFKSLIADSPSALAGISINPNPLGSPLNLSIIILADSTCPKASKVFCRSSSVTSRDRQLDSWLQPPFRP